MERKRWRSITVMAVAFVFFAGFLSSALAEDVILKVVKKWGKKAAIEMENDTPILGLEFTLNDMPNLLTAKTIKTTSRTRGFLIRFNDLGDEGVKVILVSLNGKAISPGNGAILEVFYKGGRRFFGKKAGLELSGVNIADIKNQPIKASLVGTSF